MTRLMKGRHDKTRQQKARHLGEEAKEGKKKTKQRRTSQNLSKNLAPFLNFISMD